MKMKITIESLNTDRMTDYLRFFDDKAFTDNPRWAGCYCYFPLHDPTQTQWQTRTGAENRAAVCECIEQRRAPGYLAYHDGDVIGWCSAGPWSRYPMLRDDSPANVESMGAIFCFVVAPEYRRLGVAAALLGAACDGLRAQGLKSVRARPPKDAVGPAANHLGPLSMYLRAGFRVVREDTEGNVYVHKDL
jgi:GNAT superfamily N-acetyltransferase